MTELGSEWHTLDVAGPPGPRPWTDARFTATARGALHLALDALNVERLWVPSYACQSFLAAVVDRVKLIPYADRPDEPFVWPAADATDGVLVHNPFGLRVRPVRGPGRVIEDHTHAPFSAWAHESEADVCIASVRKVLPVADGAVTWSPRGFALPAVGPLPESVRDAVLLKRAGMNAKAAYLKGDGGDKAAFRALLAQGEDTLWSGRPAPMSEESRQILATADTARLLRLQRTNVGLLNGAAPPVVVAQDPSASMAFFVFDTPHERDRVRGELITRGLYPSALWPLDDAVVSVSDADRSLSRRSFVLPLDLRATAEHLAVVLDVLA